MSSRLVAIGPNFHSFLGFWFSDSVFRHLHLFRGVDRVFRFAKVLTLEIHEVP